MREGKSMSADELLDSLDTLADDFMKLAVETDGAFSGTAAVCSNRLKDIHGDFVHSFRELENTSTAKTL